MLKQSTLEFYRELSKNNNRDWFEQNRKRYEDARKDYHRVAGEFLQRIQHADPAIRNLQVKDCVFRIYRDIRFSPDKTPYKIHMGISISPMGRKFESAGYYIHLEEGNSFAGGGIWMPSPVALKKLRHEIDVFYDEIRQVLDSEEFKATYKGLDIEGNNLLSRPPKGYSADNPAIEILKFKSFTASKPLPDKFLTDPQAFDKVTDILLRVKPLNDFFNRGLRD
jgi:uncharacterized protein (TIGR02453 family)